MATTLQPGDAEEWNPEWDIPVSGRGLLAGLVGMLATAIVFWPVALSVSAGILATKRRRYRTIAWFGVVLGVLGVVVTVIYAVIIATTP